VQTKTSSHAMLDTDEEVVLVPRPGEDPAEQCRSPLRCLPLQGFTPHIQDEDAVHKILHAITDTVARVPGVQRLSNSMHTAFLGMGDFLLMIIPFLIPPLAPFAFCKPPNSCKLMPFPFLSLRMFGKPLAPFGFCFNTSGNGIQWHEKGRGFDVKDPRTIVWEASPSCKGKVRIHYVDGEGSTGMNNKPEKKDDDEKKHWYHAMTFISISPGNRRKFREAMVHRSCVKHPMSAIFSANPLQMLKNSGGPNFLMPFLLWMPLDEFDFMSFQVAQREAGGDCEVDS